MCMLQKPISFMEKLTPTPFKLDHVNLQRVELYVDGVALRPIHTDFEKSFITNTCFRLNLKHSTSLYDFECGYTVFHIKNVYKSIRIHRHSHLEFLFSKPLKTSFVVLIQRTIPTILQIPMLGQLN